jgi:hypothetical protein
MGRTRLLVTIFALGLCAAAGPLGFGAAVPYIAAIAAAYVGGETLRGSAIGNGKNSSGDGE